MKSIFVEPTFKTPEIILDKNNNKFLIAGRSMPEDVKEFYNPLKAWLTDYFENPNKNTEFTFNLMYYNTASSKMILDIMYLVKNGIDAGHNAKVIWEYAEDDEEMMEAGEDFADMVSIPVELKCTEISS
ncbi:MAG: DUF1987 domain-containing protein [Chlorobi bacterium]|nr:DUF1987 domain-containing protein [Chlorobiota bacterium]